MTEIIETTAKTADDNNTNNNNNDNKINNSEEDNKNFDANLTMSTTKLSTDQLICKSPQDSISHQSINDDNKNYKNNDINYDNNCNNNNSVYYLGILQILFGMLMVAFGVLVIMYNASLAHLGSGIWGGSLAIATGITGIFAAANQWCPLKTQSKKIAHTTFLALSLISLAISQLIVVIAATGLIRDINYAKMMNQQIEAMYSTTTTTTTSTPSTVGKISITLPGNYKSLLANIGLLIVSIIECILALIASYKSAKMLCSCFKTVNDYQDDNLTITNRHALVSSWLGKHNPPPQLYVVTAPTSTSKGSKLSTTTGLSAVRPIFTLPPPHHQQPPAILRYPLIPAPLGSIPSPIIPPPPTKKELLRANVQRPKSFYPIKSNIHHNRHSKERVITEEDVVRTYTGLDKVIAEEFIDICDSRNVSLCSDSSCQDSCNIRCNNSNNSDSNSTEFLVNKIL